MSTNTFNIGKDCQVVLIAGNGSRVDLSIVTDFKSKQRVHNVDVRPLNGPSQQARLPDGWEGSFDIDRANSAADDLFSQIESGFWAGGQLTPGTVYQYVTEVNGSQSTYQYNGVSLSFANAGEWKADDAVKQTVEFFASTRKRI